MDYLKDLGITAVWLSPILKSPQKDFGYDIEDYTQVDPIYGTNEILQNLITALKSAGKRIPLTLI